ncbi:biotin-independent malonate decarboxylase subunit gamma [Acinetobacter portensis]|uniref:Biotin-independent malonate decarboxylase subunit gamma n=1 Tax=Acinetobacter portensis TaxID=1839785 RepID=A0ABY4JUD5_9GAMM|nr:MULTISPECIES: biotin-independent malonate decarboxylase subunit gamma [Acinetobacter]MCK7608696.1 biotin-independent malonate decarboxylase subunit gamma [Acinetobacter portensis]MCK7639538.1 biotin-independent malonate decarboxylase subunit gamma [Acinetobacter portensis]MDY6458325.1 biotin-independent malonate decarboxylase subunit gamma [Acinetobacter faecalis]UPO22697.1 biotin-independent malonate decarboxylase subunit gamma [Acinetobacter portensis]
MNTEQVLNALFPDQLKYEIDGYFIKGQATTVQGDVRIIGTVNSAPINQDIAIKIADEILDVIRLGEKTPVVFIVDTQGQALSRTDEVLCLNRTFAHLASCVDLLRREQHPNFSLILGEAVSGGFLSYGLMANEIYALDESQVKVMDLNAMSRVTKIPVDKLQALSKSSSIFAPGVENFYKMGAINSIWKDLNTDLVAHAILNQQQQIESFKSDQRRNIAEQRQGRMLCNDVISKILHS